jgi:cytochrome bd ubiquinol oxidase subunit II
MTLVSFWFGVIAVLWSGFMVLEGFDFGVGMLHSIVGRDEPGRRLAISTIAPTWDGNEVWLVVAAAAMFAAFPDWYATAFSAYYLVLVIMLGGLIARGISIEYRDRTDSDRSRRAWDALLTGSSVAVPFVVGVLLGGLLHGVPIDSSQEFTGSFASLLQPYALYVGLTFTLICALHGGTFLALRSSGAVRDRATTLTRRLGPLTAAVTVGFAIWTRVVADRGVFAVVVEVVAVLAVVMAGLTARHGREGVAFLATTFGLVTIVLSVFGSLYPNVMVSSTKAGYDLTINNTASGSYTLKAITVVVAVFFPVVLVYQVWTYRVFRQRLGGATTTPSEAAVVPAPGP